MTLERNLINVFSQIRIDLLKMPKGRARPSLLNQCLLSDGRLAWPVAQAAGLSEATFRARLNAGLSPDAAIAKPVPVRDPSRAADRARRVTEYQAAQAAAAREKRRALPDRFNLERDGYGGVIWSDEKCRLVVAPRGAFYALQKRIADDEWQSEREFNTASSLGVWLSVVAVEAPSPGLSRAVAALPYDPAACSFKPYRRTVSS